MSKLLTQIALDEIKKPLGVEPFIFFSIEWSSGIEYYADKVLKIDSDFVTNQAVRPVLDNLSQHINPDTGQIDFTDQAVQAKYFGFTVDAYGVILEFATITTQGKSNGEGIISSISVTLDDTTEHFKSKMNTEEFEGTNCTVYYNFQGLTSAAAIQVFKGKVCSDISWSEGQRTISFEIESTSCTAEIGYAPEEGDVTNMNPSVEDKMWPMIFGSVGKVPAVRLKKYMIGSLGHAVYKGMTAFKVIGGENFPQGDLDVDGPEDDPLLHLDIRGYLFKGTFSGDIFTAVVANAEQYILVQVGNRQSHTVEYSNTPYFMERGYKYFTYEVTGIAEEDVLNHSVLWLTPIPVDSPIIPMSQEEEDAAGGPQYAEGDFYKVPNIRGKYCLIGGMVNKCVDQNYTKCTFAKPWTVVNKLDENDPKTWSITTFAVDNTLILKVARSPQTEWAEDYTIEYERHDDEGNFIEIVQEVRAYRGGWKIAKGAKVVMRTTENDLYICNSLWESPVESRPDPFNVDDRVLCVYGRRQHDGQSSTDWKIPIRYYTKYYDYPIRVKNKEYPYYKMSDDDIAALSEINRNAIDARIIDEHITEYVVKYVTALEFTEPLEVFEEENWSGEIFVTIRSSHGANTSDIIKYLITTYTDLEVDEYSFDQVAVDLQYYPSNFAALSQTDVLNYCEKIAWQARCDLHNINGKIFIRYLSKAPTSIGDFPDNGTGIPDDLEVGMYDEHGELNPSVYEQIKDNLHKVKFHMDEDTVVVKTAVFGYTSLENICPKIQAVWHQDYAGDNAEWIPVSDRSQQEMYYRNNIGKFNHRKDALIKHFFIYNHPEYVKLSLYFWGYRLSNSWRTITTQNFINTLYLQVQDCIEYAIPPLSLNSIKGIIENLAHDTDSHRISITSTLASKSGSCDDDGQPIEDPNFWIGDPRHPIDPNFGEITVPYLDVSEFEGTVLSDRGYIVFNIFEGEIPEYAPMEIVSISESTNIASVTRPRADNIPAGRVLFTGMRGIPSNSLGVGYSAFDKPVEAVYG